MEIFLISGIAIGFLIGYPLGLFIDKLDKKEKDKDGRR
jgi:NhaP-type Na+/H+ or K+/H+ antiporter